MWSISAEQRCGSVGQGGESAAKIVAAGGRADVATFDVTDTAALQQWIQGAADSTGRLDVLVNNAGFGAPDQTIADGDPEFWRGMLETNVLALAVGCQAAIKAMRTTNSEGNIVNISSVAALRRESGVYGATKHAVNCINSTLRQELEYVVAQPIELNIEELVIRPQKSLF